MAEFLECKHSFLMSTIWIWKDRCRMCLKASQATDSWLKPRKRKTMSKISNSMVKVQQRSKAELLLQSNFPPSNPLMVEVPTREKSVVTYPSPSLSSLHRSTAKVVIPNTTFWIHHLRSSNKRPHQTRTRASYSLREWKSYHRLNFRLTHQILPCIVT